MNSNENKKSLIIKAGPNKSGGMDYLIKSGVKLNQILDELPSGIINKTETGIGATSLELSSARNSIIVLPTIQTAKSKSGGKVHYFSSEASETGKIRTKGKKDFLQEYLKRMEGDFKKITVVADSLPQLLDALGDNVYKDYFLLLDEIDSIQKDSSFRKRMETCLEYYKEFPNKNRAVVSATIIAFSDPSFKDEALTNFKYEKTKKGEILFTETVTLEGSAVEKIIALLDKEKIVVAVNEVQSAIDMANYLSENNHINKDEIAILCGKSPKNVKRIKEFNLTGIENKKYPCKLNFITSAFFTGYDIDESYHLIILSDPKTNHLRLSEHEIQQIIGRCRLPHKLFSINILYIPYTKPSDLEENSIERLIQFSETEISALNCVSKHYDSDELGRTKAEKMREILAKSSGFENFNFVHKNSSGKYVTSHLNIDAYIEDQRVKHNVYENNYLKKHFEGLGYKSKKETHYSTLLVTEQDARKNEIENSHRETMDFLFSKKNKQENEIKLYMKSANSVSTVMCKFYLKASQLISKKKIKEVLSASDTTNKLVKLDAAFDAFSAGKTDFTKRNILMEFPVGSTFLPDQLAEKINELLVVKLKQIEKSKYSQSKGRKMVASYIEFKKTTKHIDNKNQTAYTVKSHNPYGFRKN